MRTLTDKEKQIISEHRTNDFTLEFNKCFVELNHETKIRKSKLVKIKAYNEENLFEKVAEFMDKNYLVEMRYVDNIYEEIVELIMVDSEYGKIEDSIIWKEIE